MNRVTKSTRYLIFIFIVLALGACSNDSEEPPSAGDVTASPPVEETATPEPTALAEPVFGVATVDNLDILMLESFPIQINVILQGELPNDCVEVDEVTTERDGNTFNLEVLTVQNPGQACSETETPFEEIVSLDVLGLEAGTYRVVASDVEETFTFEIDNVIQEETVDVSSNVISGQIWHDLCSITPGDNPEPSEGCTPTEDGGFQANGLLEDEPGIEGVNVALGEGACPSEGLASTTTDEDGLYSFEELEAGTYCVSVDIVQEQNQSILLPGTWTFPEEGVAQTTVSLIEGLEAEPINFGWDYEFLPAPEVDLSTCTDSFEFVQDLNFPDDTTLTPGTEFTKSWLLRNNGTCPWSTDYSVVFIDGDLMSAEESLPLEQPIAAGQELEVSIDMVAPETPGTYRGNWQLADTSGQRFGVDGFVDEAFWLQIVVALGATPAPTPLPNSAAIGGVVWDDFCLNSDPGRGCLETPEGSGYFVGDGTLNPGELRLSEITITLAEGACPSDGTLPQRGAIIGTSVTDEDGLYRFEDLSEGPYCVFMDALSSVNVDFLIPGNWTWPATGVGRYSIILDPGEQILDLDFGWDYLD